MSKIKIKKDKLSYEELNIIREWLDRKSKNPCPFCSHNNFDIGDYLVKLQLCDETIFKAHNYPCFVVMCRNCTYTMLFNANKQLFEEI